MKFKPGFQSKFPSSDFLSRVRPEPFLSLTNFTETSLSPLKIPSDIRHEAVYVAGNPGSGKTSLLQHMILEDIRAGHGVCVIDPTGDLAKKIIHWIPKNRVPDTFYFDTANPLPIDFFSYHNDPDERDVLTDQLLALLGLDEAPVSIRILEQIIGTLFDANEQGGHFTFLDIARFIESEDTRKAVWPLAPHREAQWPTQKLKKIELSPTLLQRLTRFSERSTLRKIFDEPPVINISDLMRDRKILLVKLKQNATDRFIGSLIFAKFQQATFARSDTETEADREPFFLYLDECQLIIRHAAEAFSDTLTQARKYNLCLTLANQLPDDTDFPEKIRQKLPMLGTVILMRLDDPTMFKRRIPPPLLIQIPTLPKFTAVASLPKSTTLVSTPRFLGASPASYAQTITNRIGDKPSSNSPPLPHTDRNAKQNKDSDDYGESSL